MSPKHNRQVIYSMMVSLDGYIESRDGAIDWSVPDEELHQHFNDFEQEIDTHLYGRRMYENMAGYWTNAGDNPQAAAVEKEYACIWNQSEKIVFSTTLERVGENARVIRDNLPEAIRTLKAEEGRDMDLGGASIAASFIEHDLVDEYRLYIHPVVLGGGKRMFPELLKQRELRLLETRQFGCGVVLLRYARKESEAGV